MDCGYSFSNVSHNQCLEQKYQTVSKDPFDLTALKISVNCKDMFSLILKMAIIMIAHPALK